MRGRRRPAAWILVLTALLVALGTSPVALAAPAPTLSLLMAGSPGEGWRVSTSKSMSQGDIYGPAAKVSGFSEGYERVWLAPDQVMSVILERYSSLFWASFRQGQSMSAARNNPNHSSYQPLTGYGSGAYETTDPPDNQGYEAHSIVLIDGEYRALIRLEAKTTPDRPLLLAYAKKQIRALPDSQAANQALGSIIIGGIFAVVIVIAALVLVTVLVARRHTAGGRATAALSNMPPGMPMGYAPPGSPIGQPPPGAPVSPDGRYWWDGAAWRPVP